MASALVDLPTVQGLHALLVRKGVQITVMFIVWSHGQDDHPFVSLRIAVTKCPTTCHQFLRPMAVDKRNDILSTESKETAPDRSAASGAPVHPVPVPSDRTLCDSLHHINYPKRWGSFRSAFELPTSSRKPRFPRTETSRDRASNGASEGISGGFLKDVWRVNVGQESSPSNRGKSEPDIYRLSQVGTPGGR